MIPKTKKDVKPFCLSSFSLPETGISEVNSGLLSESAGCIRIQRRSEESSLQARTNARWHDGTGSRATHKNCAKRVQQTAYHQQSHAAAGHNLRQRAPGDHDHPAHGDVEYRRHEQELLTKNALKKTPNTATPQAIPNKVQPSGPRIATSIKGVYVPAINK